MKERIRGRKAWSLKKNKEGRSPTHGEKIIKFWALGRKKGTKGSMDQRLKQEVESKEAQKGGR